jgi:hypothetical protein
MANDNETTQLLRIVVALLGRQQFSEPALRKIVTPSSRSTKLLKAYNQCDGTRVRAEIAKACRIDKDNFNKAVNRWIRLGVVFELRQEGRRPLLHLYPLPLKAAKEE